jgi:restriction system protein
MRIWLEDIYSMTMWLVRAGKAGEFEKLAFDNRCAIIGWQELPDLTPSCP